MNSRSRTAVLVRPIAFSAILAGMFAAMPLQAAEKDRSVEPTLTVAARYAPAGEFPYLRRATAWLNSAPLTADDLRGNVVLIDFWTYSCINWRRSLPYVRAWAKAYKPQGLVVIGVHTPEFRFENDIDNVRRSLAEARIDYPVAMDNDYAIWTAFSNVYWPAIYLIDANGKVRYHHFGEGSYAATERALQTLLAEAGASDLRHTVTPVEARGVEAGADWASIGSPETYAGYGRGNGFASPGGAVRDRPHRYAFPGLLPRNAWALTGTWSMGSESVVSSEGDGRVRYRFHARDLHLVMGSASRHPVRFRVRIDGNAPGRAHGIDIGSDGRGTLHAYRLYQIIRQAGPIQDRLVEIEFLDPGADLYAFTFG